MFEGDHAQAGRRERLMRKRDAKDAFTDKIGGGGYSAADTPSNVPNSLFGGTPSSTAYSQKQFPQRGGGGAAEAMRFDHDQFDTASVGTGRGDGTGRGGDGPSARAQRGSRSGKSDSTDITRGICSQPAPSSMTPTPGGMQQDSDVSGNFKHRVKVASHGFEVTINCCYPLVDMTSNAKRRTITWYANADGDEDSFSLQIPQQFDLGGASLLKDEFQSGHCIVSIPAISRNVFS